MFKKAFLFIALLSSTSFSYGYQSDYITYDWLAEKGIETGYTDHIPHWKRLFNITKVRGFLECGCGYSTAYFLHNAEKVISIEYAPPGYGTWWYQEFLSLYSDRPNWIPMLYNEDQRSNSFNNACAYQCSMHKDYASVDAAYLKELFQHFKAQIKLAQTNGSPIDVAFVDPGVFIRGDMVKLLLAHKIPIIAAQGTMSDAGIEEKTNLYGWNKVVTPPTYVKIFIPFGQGTTFWISKQLSEIIDSMQDYRDQIVQLQELGFSPNVYDLTEIADDVR